MNNFETFFEKNWKYFALALLVLLFFRTCNRPTDIDLRNINKRIDSGVMVLRDIKMNTVIKKDLQIEGLKSEKRMIQATDRKMLDVNRQTEIDEELKRLEQK